MMFKKILLSCVITFSAIISFSQSYDWTKEDRSEIYEDGLSAVSKNKSLTKEQRESLALCFLEEITKNYSKREYKAKIDIEIKRIQQAAITLCSKNLSLKTEVQAEPVEPVKNNSKVNEGNFSRNDLIGTWRDENSKFFLNEDGTYLVKLDNGKSHGGKWWINNDKLVILERYTKMNIISFDGKNMKYQKKGLGASKAINLAEKVE